MRKKIIAIGMLIALISGTFLTVVPTTTSAVTLPWQPPTVGDDFFNYTVDGTGKVVSLKYWNVVNNEYRTWYYNENITGLWDDFIQFLEETEWDGFLGGYWVDTTWVALAMAHLDPNQTGVNAIITANSLKVSQSLDLLDNYIGNIGEYNASINLVTLAYANGIMEFSREISKVSPTKVSVTQRAAMYRDLFNSYRSLMVDLSSVFAGSWTWWTPPFGGLPGIFGSQAGTKAVSCCPTMLQNITNAIDKNAGQVIGTATGRNVIVYVNSADDIGVALALVTDFLVYREFFFHKSWWVGYYLRGKEAVTVVDDEGNTLSGVVVVYTHTSQTDYEVSFLTDDTGQYEAELPRGPYYVTVRKGGYEDLDADTSIRFLQNEEQTYAMEPEDIEEQLQPYQWFMWGGIAVIVVLMVAIMYRNRQKVSNTLKKLGKL